MIALGTFNTRVRPLIERLDQMSLRERMLIFSAGVALIYCLWQVLLMDPLMVRTRAAESRLNSARDKILVVDQAGAVATQDPAVIAAARNRALQGRLRVLDRELATLAQGYVSPAHMTDMLRELLARQRGLQLISLTNLPPRSLSKARAETAEGAAPVAASPAHEEEKQELSKDRGPFLHPVEIVVEGDYLAMVDYLHELEHLAYRIHWDRVEVDARHSPANRVRIVIGALSLSPEWITV